HPLRHLSVPETGVPAGGGRDELYFDVPCRRAAQRMGAEECRPAPFPRRHRGGDGAEGAGRRVGGQAAAGRASWPGRLCCVLTDCGCDAGLRRLLARCVAAVSQSTFLPRLTRRGSTDGARDVCAQWGWSATLSRL